MVFWLNESQIRTADFIFVGIRDYFTMVFCFDILLC